MRHHSRATLKLCAPKSCEFLMEIVCAVNASWSNGAVLAVLEQFTGIKYFVENNEKEVRRINVEILKNIGDVLKIDGRHPESEELEEAAIESDADIVMVPPDED